MIRALGKHILHILIAGAVLLLLFLWLAPHFIGAAHIQGALKEALQTRTAWHVEVAPDASLSLLPSPELNIASITLTDPNSPDYRYTLRDITLRLHLIQHLRGVFTVDLQAHINQIPLQGQFTLVPGKTRHARTLSLDLTAPKTLHLSTTVTEAPEAITLSDIRFKQGPTQIDGKAHIAYNANKQLHMHGSLDATALAIDPLKETFRMAQHMLKAQATNVLPKPFPATAQQLDQAKGTFALAENHLEITLDKARHKNHTASGHYRYDLTVAGPESLTQQWEGGPQVQKALEALAALPF